MIISMYQSAYNKAFKIVSSKIMFCSIKVALIRDKRICVQIIKLI